MSALAWLFGLGALAIAFPFVFHLIRQTPKGRTEFSSLMFLKPTPPRLTQRSRLQNILLLLLRAAIVLLIAFAFMRPFFRTQANQHLVEVSGRDLLFLLDTSASMQRSGLWRSALEKLDNALADVEAGDQLALATFDHRFQVVADFPNSAGDTATQVARIRAAAKELAPSFGRSDYANALGRATERLTARQDATGARSKPQIILVGDLQRSSSLAELQRIRWPEPIKLEVVFAGDEALPNAAVTGISFDQAAAKAHVRLSNSANAKQEQLEVQFVGDRSTGDRQSVYLPAGTTRSFTFELPPSSINRVQLSGDQETLDNVYYYSPPRQTTINVFYFGDDDANDAEGIRYYLERSFIDTPTRKTHFLDSPSLADAGRGLAVVTRPPNANEQRFLDAHLKDGGRVLFVVADRETAEATQVWTGARAAEAGTAMDDYGLLINIDFTTSLLAAFDRPGLNDFTNIKFWNRSALQVVDDTRTRVLACFDDLRPALLETQNGNGKAITLASSWRPQASQLATSSKFPILMNELLTWAAAAPEVPKSLRVNEPISLSMADHQMVVKPDGSKHQTAPDQPAFEDTDRPGIYTVIAGQKQIPIAINIDRSEGASETISTEQFESLGVQLGIHDTVAEERQALQLQADVEIESRQKLWKWLIGIALAMVLIETVAAGSAKRTDAAALES